MVLIAHCADIITTRLTMICKPDLKFGNCLDIMRQLPTKSIDLVLADLPYCQTNNTWDALIPWRPLWREFKRIAKNNTNFVLFGTGLFFHNMVLSNAEDFKYSITWVKTNKRTNFLNSSHQPLRIKEEIAVFTSVKIADRIYNPQIWQGQPLHSQGTQFLYKQTTNNVYNDYRKRPSKRTGETDKLPMDVVFFGVDNLTKDNRFHPTQKPVTLCEYLIKTYSNEGDTVLDCTAGSGTTGIAAMNTNRHSILIENSTKYFAVMENRIQNHSVQTKLF